MHTSNRHLHGSGEVIGAQRRTKVSFGRTVMQGILAAAVGKKARQRIGIEQCKIKALAVVVIELHLSKGISK